MLLHVKWYHVNIFTLKSCHPFGRLCKNIKAIVRATISEVIGRAKHTSSLYGLKPTMYELALNTNARWNITYRQPGVYMAVHSVQLLSLRLRLRLRLSQNMQRRRTLLPRWKSRPKPKPKPKPYKFWILIRQQICLCKTKSSTHDEIWQKAYNIRCSQAVSDPSTNRTRRCLTWQIGRDAVCSTWYGRRRCKVMIKLNT